jgi:uncharacterized protein
MDLIKNCSKCGRLFNDMGNLCPDCSIDDEKLYAEVRKYLQDHQGATIFEISDATGIREHKILQFINDGRLERRKVQCIECKSCGKKILRGTYCESCQWQMNIAAEHIRTDSSNEKQEPFGFQSFKERRNS